jgi:hypothetical protein
LLAAPRDLIGVAAVPVDDSIFDDHTSFRIELLKKRREIRLHSVSLEITAEQVPT